VVGSTAGVLRVLGAVGSLALHPLHTTITELSFNAADRTVQVSVRVFADDFRVTAGAASDSAAFAYLRSGLTLSERDGRVLLLAWCGLRRQGDLVWLCARAPAPRGLAGVRVRARLLFDLYRDQINIVQARYDGRRTSLLFSSGDTAKALP